MDTQKYAYLVKPELNRRRPAFWRLGVFLWGSEADFDSDGDSVNPDDMEWTELTLINRVDVSQRIDIDPVQLNPLVLKIGGSSQSLAARAGYFLAASTGGKVSEISKRVWRSPRMLKSQVGDFDLLEAITCVARYVSPQERNQPSYVRPQTFELPPKRDRGKQTLWMFLLSRNFPSE